MSGLRVLIAEELPYAVSLRKDFHAHPELGFQEQRTSEVVQRELTSYGVQFVRGLAKGTGVLGYLPATQEGGGTVALRADMDALPIQENTHLPYASKTPGVMHACGHDGHTAILLTTAKVLAQQKDRLNNVLFLFQPAEEGGAGGKFMVQEGALRGEVIGAPADVIYGLHGSPTNRVGIVTTRTGPMLAAAAEFSITVMGKGGHAAAPHRGIDPIVCACQLVTALQSVASRNVSPLDSVVVTIGIFHSGVAHNVIPDSAFLKGTLRTLKDEVEETARHRISEIVSHIAAAYGARAVLEWGSNPYPVTKNEPVTTERFRNIARDVIGTARVVEEENPIMGGEDFSFYGREIPASFFFLGVVPEGQETYPNLHSPDFNFNDDAIPTGVELMAELALRAI